MARAIQKANKDIGFLGRERAVVFCMYRRVGQQICQQLEKRNMRVALVADENKLAAQLNDMDPDLVFVEINAPTTKSIIRVVAETFAWMRGRAREINKALNSPSQYLWERSKIILFKSDVEISSTTSLTADMADTDDVVRECSLLGDVQYIGIYSSLSFIAKVRALIQ